MSPISFVPTGQSVGCTTFSSEWADRTVLAVRTEDLYNQTGGPMLAYLRRLGLSESDANDVVQETFLRLIHHLLAGRPERNLHAWLFQVAHSLAMDIHRFDIRFSSLSEESEDGQIRQRDVHDISLNPEEVFIQNEDWERFNVALTFLPSQQRACVVLRSNGLRYREIANNLGVSTQRVAMLVCRGVSRLVATM